MGPLPLYLYFKHRNCVKYHHPYNKYIKYLQRHHRLIVVHHYTIILFQKLAIRESCPPLATHRLGISILLFRRSTTNESKDSVNTQTMIQVSFTSPPLLPHFSLFIRLDAIADRPFFIFSSFRCASAPWSLRPEEERALFFPQKTEDFMER